MKTDIFSFSSRGGRENNEDFCRYTAEDNRCVFALADGLGGHDLGEIASEIAVDTAISLLENPEENSIGGVIALTGEALLAKKKEDENLSAMRTTLVLAKLQKGTLRYGGIGDSRFYFFRDGKLLLRTKDHSVPQMSVDMGTLEESMIRFSDDRNKLLKVLGSDEDMGAIAEYPPITVEKGDAFLLCSDGFWENVFETEMEVDLSKSVSAEQWGRYMLKRLLLRVSGNHDNFTLICAKIV